MNFTLEVIVLPVADVDRAKAFYESLGWRLDADVPGDDGFRVVQLTPPGSPASIIFGNGVTASTTRFYAGHLSRGGRHRPAKTSRLAAGTAHRLPGPDRNRTSYASFASFSDPDGNGWVLQEITER